jgi:methyl-accepting chemotaxis protein
VGKEVKYVRAKKLGIGGRLALMVTMLTAAAIAVLVGVIGLRVSAFATENAKAFAAQAARAGGTAVQAVLQDALSEAGALAKVFEAASVVANAGISRRQANSILRYFIEHSPGFFGAYVAFEPNAYDGKDANFVDEWGHDESGRFVPYWTRDASGAAVLEPLVGYESAADGAYYQAPKKSGHEAIIDPYKYKTQGTEVLMSSLVAPIRNTEGRFIGIAGIDLTLAPLQKTVDEAVLFKTGRLTVFSADGKVAGAKDLAFIGRRGTEVGFDAADMEKLAQGQGFTRERKDARGRQVLSIGVPFMVGKTQAWWSVVADIPVSEVLGPVTSLILLIVLLGAFAVLLVTGVVLLIARSLSRPLGRGAAFAQQIAAGNLGATLDVGKRGDEIGTLAAALNAMTENLRGMTRRIQDGAGQLATGTGQLSAAARQLSEGAQSQASTLEETSAAVEELTSSAAQVSEHAQRQSTTVGGTAAGMQKMRAAMDGLAGSLTEVAGSAEGSVQRARHGAASVREAIAAIKDISLSSEKIAGIVTVISEIADQTNLLALNAAIEAARAGEHGRGFAVVADEVSKLAERSATSTGEITELIAESLRQVKRGVGLAEGSGASMQEIIDGAMAAAETVAGLQASIGDQMAAVAEMSTAVGSLREMSEGISAAADEQSTNSRQVSGAIESVNQITQQAAAAAEQMAGSVGDMAGLAKQLEELAGVFRLDDGAAARPGEG